MSTTCPKNVNKCLKNVQKLSRGAENTIFGHFLPIWSMLLFGDPVQRTCALQINVNAGGLRLKKGEGILHPKIRNAYMQCSYHPTDFSCRICIPLTVIFEMITFLIQKHFKTATVTGNGKFGKINSNDFQDGNWVSMEMKGRLRTPRR